MSGSPTYKTSKFEYDGGFLLVVPSGRLVNAASAVVGGGFVAPFSGEVVDYHVNIGTQFTHASSTLSFGLESDPDSGLDDFVTQNLATGYRNLIGDTWVSKAITIGNFYRAATLAAADTTGVLAVTAVMAPS